MTTTQKDLARLLVNCRVEKELAMAILIALQKSEYLMKQMSRYIMENNPTETQVMEKFVEMVKNEQRP